MTENSPAGEGQHAFTPPSPAELQAKFPQLEILGFIGQGGMGAVYQARQRQLDRVVALKILPPGIGEDPAFAERFAREAKAMAKLNHPGIVTIHDFGRADGLFYFLMEFVDGVSLAQLMQAGRVSPREALAIVPQICDALQYAHDQGLVHRDIKPENILLDRRGRVKVADFGLVKLMEGGSEPAASQADAPSPALTQAGKVMGTPRYMAPEQLEHPTEVDHRADIYALGVVFYQMLTGELPGKPLQPPSTKVRVDVRLDEVVLRALEKEPERRYQQASQVKTAVETVAGTPVQSKTDEKTPRTRVAPAFEPAVSPSSESAHRPSASPRTHSSALAGSETCAPAGSEAGAAKPMQSPRPVVRALVFGLALLIAIGLLAFAASWFTYWHLQAPTERLSQTMLTQLLNSNRVTQATISQSPGSPLAEVSGRYLRVENNRNVEVPFRATVRLIPELEKKLLDVPQVTVKTRNSSLASLVDGSTQGEPITSQSNLAGPQPVISPRGNRELLESQFHQAETEFARFEKLHDAKAISDAEFEAGVEKLEILKATLDGDPIRGAQVRLESAERRLQRLSLLFTNKLISTSEFETAQLEVQRRRVELKAADEQARFGPVITRVLGINGDQCNFLVLRTGEVLHHSVDRAEMRDETPPTEFIQWIRSNHVDVGFCFTTDKFHPRFCLNTFDMGTFSFPADTVSPGMIPRFTSVAEWEAYNATHSEPAKYPLIGPLVGVTNVWNDLKAAQLEDPPDGPAFFLKEKHFALCFACTNSMAPVAFCTREGLRGMFQVTSFTVNPPTVSLRYKLMAPGDSVPAGAEAAEMRKKKLASRPR